MTSSRIDTVALVGNPNCGKTALFNALTGGRQKVANYAGVTVERKEGIATLPSGRRLRILDLPGTYSLRARSPDEAITRDAVLGRLADEPAPDVIVCVADATNLGLVLRLALELKTTGLPMVFVLNMIDIAERQGIDIDFEALSRELGAPVTATVATRKRGLETLLELAASQAEGMRTPPPSGWREPTAADVRAAHRQARELMRATVRPPSRPDTLTGRLDSVLLHPVGGVAILLGLLFLMFQAVFTWAAPAQDLIEAGFGALGVGAAAVLPDGWMTGLVVDGLIAGVGSVLVFLPQILILFLFILLLEDSGYMARAAFLMDRIMGGAGLHGRAFIPLLSSFACAIPGIMAARTIENRRDRLLTILVAPLMSCSARLPVYLLLCGAFIPNVAVGVPWLRLPAVVLVCMYAVGVIVAAIVASILSRTVFRGPPQPFVMELPGWRWPRPAVVAERVREAAWSFLKNAGTLILAMSVVIWALGSYPKPVLPAAATLTEAEQQGEALRQSFLGRAGRLIEPVVRPLGWDWRLGCAAVASFPAREVVLGTLGVIYNLGDVDPGEEEGATALVRRLKAATWDGTDRKVFTVPVALSLMVFFALCAQCASTLVVIGKETGSWVWPVVTFTYMTALAWLGAFVTYQLGTALGW